MPNDVFSMRGARAVAMKPWHRPPHAARLHAMRFDPLHAGANYQEVQMTTGGFRALGVIPELRVGGQNTRCLWTGNASGGCTPFGVIVRDRRNRHAAEAIGLAHLCSNPVGEARWLGDMFRRVTAAPHDVYLVMMKLANMISMDEAEQYFDAFDEGFGRQVPEHNKTILRTISFHAAVNMEGYFGEVSDTQWVALSALSRGHPATVVNEPNLAFLVPLAA